MIDAQSMKTSTSVPAAGQGTDNAKKIVGRKRSIVTDTLGLLLAALVTAPSVQDSNADTLLLDEVAADHLTIRKTWVDGGDRKHFRRARRHPRHRHGDQRPHPRDQGIHPDTHTLGRGAHLRLADAPPPPGPPPIQTSPLPVATESGQTTRLQPSSRDAG